MAKQFIFVNANGDEEQTLGAYEQADFIGTSVGVGDSGKPIKLDAGGKIDASMIEDGDIDHGLLTGLGDDDHIQYSLVDGTRAYTGKESYSGAFTFVAGSNEIPSVKYVDDEILANVVTSHSGLTGLTADDHTLYTLADGTRAFTGSQSMGANKLTNLADGTATSDAVNFGQLSAVSSGFDKKENVRVATTTALPAYTKSGVGIGATLTGNANGILTIDGISMVVGDRVLVKNENGAQNSEGSHIDHGIYDVTTEGTVGASFVLTRSVDADGSPANEVTTGLYTFVIEGTANGKTGWDLRTTNPITVDTTALLFNQFQGIPSAYTASLGVVLSGLDFRANLLASGGLKLTGNEMGVEPNDFAGVGLIDDGADNLAIDWSTAFNDAKAVKASDLASVANGFGASIIGVEDLGTFYTATTVEGVLAEIAPQLGSTTETYTAGTGGVTKGDLVYISSANTVVPYADITVAQAVIGMALTTESANNPVQIVTNNEIITGILAGATPGTKFFWNGSGHTTSFSSFSSSEYIWLSAVAKNTTDAQTSVKFIMKKA